MAPEEKRARRMAARPGSPSSALLAAECGLLWDKMDLLHLGWLEGVLLLPPRRLARLGKGTGTGTTTTTTTTHDAVLSL